MQNNTFFILYLNNIQNNIPTCDLTINSESDVRLDIIAEVIELPCTALLCNEPGEKVKTFSSARLDETQRVSSNEPDVIESKELTHINDTTYDIIEIPTIILQNHINYNFSDLLNECSDEIFYYLKTIDNETILYKRYEHNDTPAELQDLNPLVPDNVASYSVSGIYYFNKCNDKGYLLNLNYINKLWYINCLSIIQKENDINLYINNGIYYILKTINTSESYLAKVELVKQLPNMNKHIYKSKNKLYENGINGTVTHFITLV